MVLLLRFARRIARECGYSIVEVGEFPGDFAHEDVAAYRAVQPYTLTSIERVTMLRRSTEYIVENALPGCFVECGVWRGGSMMAVAETLIRLNATDRQLYLFDTFEGMPAPGEANGTDAKTDWSRHVKQNGQQKWYAASLEDVEANLRQTGYPMENVHLVRGMVEETLPSAAPEQIALLRLDTDWYESTLHELNCLYPRLVTGGVLIIDDYGHYEGCKKAVGEYFAQTHPAPLLMRIDYAARTAIKI